MTMTLEQFRASKREAPLAEMTADPVDADTRCLIYGSDVEGFYFITISHTHACYHLLLERDEWLTDDLPMLEGLLHDYYLRS